MNLSGKRFLWLIVTAVSENIHTHPKEGHWKFLAGGGGGSNQKNLPWIYFLEPHII